MLTTLAGKNPRAASIPASAIHAILIAARRWATAGSRPPLYHYGSSGTYLPVKEKTQWHL
jgi:multiple sugar transport system ATP-binding protein